jgi:hypothetical protein
MLVHTELQRQLTKVREPVTGLTSLAAGADQIFAQAVLQAGGQIIAILPSGQLETSFEEATALARFQHLLARADEISRMPFDEPSEQAYWAAGRAIVERSDRLFAVWDGKPAAGLGGTADVVAYARERGTSVTVIWPKGCTRP